MAVHHVRSGEVTEVEIDIDPIVGAEHDHVLAHAVLPDRRRPAVARQDLKLLHVDVDGVTPAPAAVGQRPHLACVDLDRGIGLVHVEDISVHGPAAAGAIEHECPVLDDLREVDGPRRAEHARQAARIRLVERRHAELEQRLAGGEQLAGWTATIGLLGTVEEIQPGAGLVLREVDDHVVPLGHPAGDNRALHRSRQQVAVVGDLNQRRAVTEREAVEARRAAVEQAEAVLPRLDVEVRPNLAVHRELVAQDAVKIEEVVDELPAGVEHLVAEHERHVVRSARQLESARVQFVAAIERIEEAVASREAGVNILSGEILPVVVIPQRVHALRRVVDFGRRRETIQRVRIVVVPARARLEEVPGKPIALRRGVTVVQVRRD